MSKQPLAKNKRELLRLAANLDGKYQGITQKQVDVAYRLIETLDVVATIHGIPSPLVMLRKKAKKKAIIKKKQIAKAKKAARKKLKK